MADVESTPTSSSNDEHRLLTREEVFRAERRRIETRREKAFPSRKEFRKGIQSNFVGLSLSGGGLRSAATCLGVIQTIYRRGVLRFVDFLSTVSGGGYAGAYLSSMAIGGTHQNQGQHRDKRPDCRDEEDESQSALNDAFPIDPGCGDKQPKRMRAFIYGGHYLNKTWRFFNRYASGLLLVLTLIVSGFVAAAAGLAWAFRLLDDPAIKVWASALGFKGDLLRALIPTFVFFLCWTFFWLVSFFQHGRRATGKIARVFFMLTIVTLLIAVSALMGNGQTGIGGVGRIFLGESPDGIIGSGSFRTVVLILISVGLVPYLNPKKLIRSGSAPASTSEKYTFWIASRALLYGVPFLLIGLFAQENISGYNDRRSMQLYQTDIPRDGWSVSGKLWSQVAPEETSPFHGSGLLELIEESASADAELGAADLGYVPQSVSQQTPRERGYNTLDQHGLYLITRMGHLIHLGAECILHPGLSVSDSENPLCRYVTAQAKQRAKRETIIRKLNEQLSSPVFYAGFIHVRAEADRRFGHEDTPAKKTWIRKIQNLKEDASLVSKSKTSKAMKGRAQQVAAESEVRARLAANRKLLEAYYGEDIFRDRSVVYNTVVLNADQATRLWWVGWATSVFVLSCILVDLNGTSCHGYYANQIASNWIEPVPGLGREIPLAQLETTTRGFPLHLISASLHLFGKREKHNGDVNLDHFLLSEQFCGSNRTGYKPTEKFMDGQMSVADAVAISGGAVSPMQISNPLVRFLLLMANMRLGQWVENPRFAPTLNPTLRYLLTRFWTTPLNLFLQLYRQAEVRSICFVTDGGHHENLGIGPLLARQCRLIMAVDAAEDPQYEFQDLAKLIRWARVKHGVQLREYGKDEPLDLTALTPNGCGRRGVSKEKGETIGQQEIERQFSKRSSLLMQIDYPNGETGLLMYLKSTLTGKEPFDLLRYAGNHAEFPHDSTADQFYDPERFESYRQLGADISDRMLDDLVGIVRDLKTDEDLDPYIAHLLQVISGKLDHVNRWLEIAADCDAAIDERQHALVELRASQDVERWAAEVIPAMVCILDQHDSDLQNQVLDVLQHFGTGNLALLCSNVASAQTAEARERMAEVIGEILLARGHVHIDSAIETLEQLLVDGSQAERRAAALALLDAPSPSSDEAQRRYIETLARICKEAADMSDADYEGILPRIVTSLFEELDQKSAKARVPVVGALGECRRLATVLKIDRMEEIIRNRLDQVAQNDASKEVRRVASQFLQK